MRLLGEITLEESGVRRGPRTERQGTLTFKCQGVKDDPINQNSKKKEKNLEK